jgi:hypothetical protein
MSAQQSSIDIEEVGIAIIPAKSLADGYESLHGRRLNPAGISYH